MDMNGHYGGLLPPSTLLVPGVYAQDGEGNYVEGEIEVQDVNGYYAGGPVVRLG